MRIRRSTPNRRQQAQRVIRLALGAIQNPSITALITQSAQDYNLDPSLVLAIAQRESGLNANAVSTAGAQGIMQLMPATARSLGVTNPFDPAQNIPAGTRYLSQLINQFSGDIVKGVAAYDWGPTSVQTAVDQFGPNWLYSAPAETQNYVQGILGISPSQVNSSEAPQQPMTIDASTGLPVEDFTNVKSIANITPGLSTQSKVLIGAGVAAAAYFILEDLL